MNERQVDLTFSRRNALIGLGIGGLAIAAHGRGASAQDASPVATAYPMDGHPLTGLWRWINFPDNPGSTTTYSIFTADGGYVEAGDDNRYTALGIWRATGERTGELVLTPGFVTSLAYVFEPEYVMGEECFFEHAPFFVRVFMEINETGNHLTATGMNESPDGNGGIIESDPYTGFADRMMLTADTSATPIG